MPRTDCALYRYDYMRREQQCIGLTEMMCVTRGKCKFYKTPEQLAAEHKKCEQRILTLMAQGVHVPNAIAT